MVSLSGKGRGSLKVSVLSLGLGLLLQGGVPLDSVQELLSALRVLDVLDSEVDSLLHVSVSDNLEDDHSNTSGGDVVDDTGLSVVALVGHTLLLSSVGLDINDISDLVDRKVRRKRDRTLLSEVPSEHVARSRSVSEGVRHLEET